ncbi:MAG: hypothetical protein WCO33_01785 [bacterium]
MEINNETPIHIPFPQIPRFPGEEPLVGAPTAETTIFTPYVADILDGIQHYIEADKVGTKDHIVSEFSKLEDLETFKTIIDCLKDNPDKTAQYEELLARVEEAYAIKQFPLPEKSKKIEINEFTFSLVHEALIRAFPSEYGTIIPILRSEDVIVLADKDYIEYSFRCHLKLIHSSNILGPKDFPGIKSTYSKMDMQVVTYLPWKPILIKESFIADRYNNFPTKAGADILVAYLLIHEAIHRITSQRSHQLKYTPYEAFIYKAFFRGRIAGNPERKIVTDSVRRKVESSTVFETNLGINGAIVSLNYIDKDAKLKRTEMTGYDINEAIVEYLANIARECLVLNTKAGYPREARAIMKTLRANDVSSVSIIHGEYTTSKLRTYLRKVKLLGIRDLMIAFKNGKIPQLHMQYCPDEDYPF